VAAFRFISSRKNKSGNKLDPEMDPRVVGNEELLKVAFVNYLRDNKPDILECKVGEFLQDKGYTVIWTPPTSLHNEVRPGGPWLAYYSLHTRCAYVRTSAFFLAS
jgi:hypothetical protein